jgi:hypothetical protein
MKPIFLVLCVIAAAMMAWTFSLGWRFQQGRADLQRRMAAGEVVTTAEIDAYGDLFPQHFVWGMVTGLYVSLIHSIVLVYFLGTGKAIKEQTDLQNWDEATYYLPSRKHMGQAVIPCVLGITGLILAAFSGGFTMIGMLPPMGHLIIAGLGVTAQIPIFIRQYILIHANGRLMDEVVERLGGDDIRLTL